ncbi:MAG: glutathione S-transferase N-terminal domain-containing protein [Tatlockia sp.]|nr:glutathione S-transferase N-terminal domain-containing protein [Tatlockia sp.]
MITLYQFPSVWGLPNVSPFCLKVETYLRFAKIPYEIKAVMDPRKAPKGKLPLIKINDKKIADSEIIIDFLKAKYGNSLDKNLTEEQEAVSALVDASFSERIYWVILYTRWQYEPNWQYVKKDFFAKLPSFSKLFLPVLIRKATLKTLYAQGIGRHSYEEILQMGYKTLDALIFILGDKKYFFGEEPSTIDATAFAFLVNILWTPYSDDLKTHLKQHKNVLNYCDRILTDFYPELTKPRDIIN